MASSWTDRYEALRSSALGHGRERWGLALVSRQGLSAWFYAWPNERGHVPQPKTSTVDDDMPDGPIAPVLSRNDLIALLAGMVMATRLSGAA